MAPRGGRGGRGGRGRGAGRGRGRGGGRGRGRGRGGYQPTFHTSRVEEKIDSDSEQSEGFEEEEDVPSEFEEEQEQSLSEDSSDEDEADKNAVRPYNALIQSLNANKPKKPQNKKRKVSESDGLDAEPAESKKVKESEVEPDEAGEVDVDQVDEPEETGDDAVHPDETADSDDEDASDPYEVHFTNTQEKDAAAKIKSISDSKWKTEKAYYDNVGRSVFYSPSVDGAVSTPFRSKISSTKDLKLKKRLYETAQEALPEFGPLEQALAPHIFNYQDVFFCARSVDNAAALRKLNCLHALDLIFKTRDRVIKNNARLSKASETEDLELRDQGFTRPKVLMILPTRQSCVRAVETIVQLCSAEQQENRKRFQDSYVQSEDSFSADRPADFRELFEGNDDDMFRLGLKFTRKTIKYFSQFYNSDIIFASPLGLRMAIGAEGSKKQDFDFLSSIELLIIDQADGLLMQNWEHVEHILAHMNLQPKEAHGCDFSRVRNFYLDGHAKYFRQTILFSPFNTPELNAVFNHQMLNLSGKAKITRDYDIPSNTTLDLSSLGVSVKQTFSRFESKSPATDPDSRFEYFANAIVPSIARQAKLASSSSSSAKRDGIGPGVLVFIPSYLDFVRVRNFFATSASTSHVSFGCISEYTPVRDVARARSHFLAGRHSVLLYSERAHHFRRFQLRGVRKVVFYAPPDNPIFYREVAGGYIGATVAEGKLDPAEAGVRVAFSKWDGLRLERIVGTKRVGSMLRERGGDTFDFV